MHMILEQAPEPETDEPSVSAGDPAVVGGVVPWVLSGRDAAALRGQAARLQELVAGAPELSPWTWACRW